MTASGDVFRSSVGANDDGRTGDAGGSVKILVDETGTPSALADMLKEFEEDTGITASLILACDANAFEPDSADAMLRDADKPLFGGVFPEVLYGGKRISRGTVVVGLSCPIRTHVVTGLSHLTTNPCSKWAVANVRSGISDHLMFVLLDGLAGGISSLVDGMFDEFGLDLNYIGGGAGSLDFVQKPCIFTNRGLLADAAVMALAQIPSGVGVAHGWEDVSHSFRVTESDGKRIISLDWRPAAEVYCEEVESISPMRFADTEFFDIAKAFPLGIGGLGDEVIVRDPLQVDGTALVCVSDVRVNAVVRILNGNHDSLAGAAEVALRDAARSLGGATPVAGLVMDCISRALFLGDGVDVELETAWSLGIPMAGALTIGEVANRGQVCLEFHNKTMAICLMGD